MLILEAVPKMLLLNCQAQSCCADAADPKTELKLHIAAQLRGQGASPSCCRRARVECRCRRSTGAADDADDADDAEVNEVVADATHTGCSRSHALMLLELKLMPLLWMMCAALCR